MTPLMSIVKYLWKKVEDRSTLARIVINFANEAYDFWVSSCARVDTRQLLHQKTPQQIRPRDMPSSIITGASAEGRSDYQVPWVELPSDVWVLIGSNLGTRDFARASTVIKALSDVHLLALNLGHSLPRERKIRELVWGFKRCSNALSAVIRLNGWGFFSDELCPTELKQTWPVYCIKELLLDVRVNDYYFSNSPGNATAYGMLLLAQMPQLPSLVLKAHVLLSLPLMPRLRQLTIVLDVPRGKCPSLEDAMTSIAALPALQSLYFEVVMPSYYYKDRVLVVDVDFRACILLQAIRLIGLIFKRVLLPPAAKLTLDIEIKYVLKMQCVMAHGLHLSGDQQVYFLKHKVDFSMLTALSLHDVNELCQPVPKICLGWYNADKLRFLSVTSKSDCLRLRLALPRLTTLVVHAAKYMELIFKDMERNAASLETVYIQWFESASVKTFEDDLRAHCRKEIFAGVLRNSDGPRVLPRRFISTRRIEDIGCSGERSHIHPCTVASGACGACLEHCCPRVYPVPQL